MKIADRSYWTNADKSKLVKEGSEDAQFLVVAKGGEVTAEMSEKYGIEGEEQEAPNEEPGIVTSGGADGRQGFVPAEDAQEAGIVVSGTPEAELAAPASPSPEDDSEQDSEDDEPAKRTKAAKKGTTKAATKSRKAAVKK